MPLAVRGYREFMRATAQLDRDTKKAVREEFRKVGDGVRADASRRASPVSSRTAAGYRTRVRQRGIAVEQSVRKVTGKHPEYGSWQMRQVLLPALYSNVADMERRLEIALDRAGDLFERRP